MDHVQASLRTALGVTVHEGWLEACTSHIQGRGQKLREAELMDKVYHFLLLSDLKVSSLGSLPPQTSQISDEVLPGPYILQIEELKNIGAPLEHRDKEDRNRCLLMSLIDGPQRVLGLEYRRMSDMRIATPKGTKLAVRKVRVKEGMLLLTADCARVLGGQVPATGEQGDGAEPMPVQREPPGQPPPPRPGPAPHVAQVEPLADMYDDPDFDWASLDPDVHISEQHLAQQQQHHAVHTPVSAPRPPPSANVASVIVSSPSSSRQDEDVIVVLDDEDALSAPMDVVSRSSPPPTPAAARAGDKGSPFLGLGPNALSSPALSIPSQSTVTSLAAASAPSEGEMPLVASVRDWRTYLGRTVRVKAVVTSLVSSRFMTKKRVLKIVVRIDDGSGALLEARLSEGMTEDVTAMPITEFRRLYDTDKAGAEAVIHKAARTLSQYEGVFTLRFPAGCDGDQPPVATVLSRCKPTEQDLKAMIQFCADALGFV